MWSNSEKGRAFQARAAATGNVRSQHTYRQLSDTRMLNDAHYRPTHLMSHSTLVESVLSVTDLMTAMAVNYDHMTARDWVSGSPSQHISRKRMKQSKKRKKSRLLDFEKT